MYWGCPSIVNFFNKDGIVFFNTLDELETKLKFCTADFYESRINAIEENFKIAKEITFTEKWIYKNKLHLNL